MKTTWIAIIASSAIAGCSSTSNGSSPVQGEPTDADADATIADVAPIVDTNPSVDTSLPPFDTATCGEAGSAREPLHHRASAVTCPRTGLTASCEETGTCGGPGWWACDAGACVYDQCVTDDECGATGVCTCIGEKRGFGAQSFGNDCVPSDCRTDADCCPGEWCSPSDDYGSFYGTQSYHCHTAQDECIDDVDCVNDAVVMICVFDPVVGHWACSNVSGAG